MVQKVYLIRRLDSLLGGISYLICGLLIGPFELFSDSQRPFLLLFPILYFLLELLLLYVYKELQRLKENKQLNYFRVNRYRSIIMNNHHERDTQIGNLVGFWSFSKIYIDSRDLIKSKTLGLIAGISGIIIIFMEAKGYALILLVLIFILLAIKMEAEGAIKESANE